MKKTIAILLAITTLSFAGVSKTTVGCADKNDLNRLIEASRVGKLTSIEDFYKFSMENNCEIIEPNDKIGEIGKAQEDGTTLIFVNKYNKNLYIRSKAISYEFTKDNNLLNKSF